MKQPLQIFQQDQAAQRSGDAQSDAIRPVLRSPLLGGTVVRGVELVAGADVVVRHGLGRVPTLWWPVDAQGGEARAYFVSSDKNGLTLHAVTTSTAAIYVA